MTGLKEHLLIILLFLVLVFFFTVPFAVHANDAVISSHVDNVLNVWIMSWDGHALVTNPTNLFQANIDYPSPDSLAFSEHLLIIALIAAPIAWITRNPIFAYNFVSLIGFALCGYTMYLLVKYLTRNRLAAVAAGAFFAFVPYHFSTIVHVHVSLYFLQPLLILFLFRYFEGGRARHLVGFGLTFLAQALFSWYQIAFASIPIGLFLLYQLLSRGRREKARYFLYVIGVLILCMLVVIPFAVPYFRLHRNIPESESRPAIKVISSARVRDYFRVLPQNYLYDKLGFLYTGNPGEGNALFPGFLIFPLSLLALACVLWRWKEGRAYRGGTAPREDRSTAGNPAPGGDPWGPGEGSPREDRAPPPGEPPGQPAPPHSYFLFFIVLGMVCFVLSLGPAPHGVNNVFYKALHKLPVYGFVRFPIRYHIMVILSLGVIAGYACTYIHRYIERKKSRLWGSLAVAGIVVLMLLEFTVVNLPYQGVAVGNAVPRVYRDLEGIEDAVIVEAPMPFVDNGVVFEDPLTLNFGTLENTFLSALREQDSVYYSIYNWKKTLNGMSGYYPLFYRRSLVEMQAFPSPRALEFLKDAGVNHIVLHWDNVPPERRDAVREFLGGSPGVTLVEDYPDNLSLYRLSGSSTVDVKELDLPLFIPDRTDPGLVFRAGLGFLNNTGEPYINQDEARQHLEITWRDANGEVVKKEGTYFYAPFFIEPGEGAAAPFQVNAPAGGGDYRLTVTATGGILQGWTWEEEVTVEGVPSAQPGEAYGGRLAWVHQGDAALGFYPGEVFSLDMGAENLGPPEWERERTTIVGSVGITALWTKEGDPGYQMQQQGMLPSDISPGQALDFPIALQAPREAGSYTLTLRLNCLGIQYIGEPVTIPVEVAK
jgi:hypothetical protein